MARPGSRASMTIQDYGTPGSGSGAEKSNVGWWMATFTAGNLVAQTGAAAAIRTAILDLILGGQSNAINVALETPGSVNITDPNAQRENKWLVRYHDTAGARYTIEIPTAKLSLLDTGTEFLDLTGTEAAAFVTAFEAGAVSPADSSAVTVDSIQFVGRRA